MTVQVDKPLQKSQLLLMEPSLAIFRQTMRCVFENSLVKSSDDGQASIILTNSTGFAQKLEKGVCIGQAMEVSVVEAVS